MKDSPVVIGEITGVYGVKGWVKVFSHTEPRINIVKYNPWFLKQGNEWKSVKLINGRSQGKTIVAQIDGVNDRNDAHAMIGTQIAIESSQLQKLGAKDFYWRDLEGLEVVDLNGDVLGRISHLIETGANDVMVVKLPAEKAQGQKIKELMIPYLMDSVIKSVDLDANQMTVDWDDDYI
ncbi:ribosome maturation factor RimM [Aliikangiella marina]|uniref:Ribosome maturation factor RimM n=1 Tax=Aliikangiella marina TaxID=1712262 RepID=A0A545TE62_9GAMM|nr:ribosome maturation factor RimM [Aliikangiella marina]TQV75512.1 ribosome maturation factor RimM [Aliikangiella marina]